MNVRVLQGLIDWPVTLQGHATRALRVHDRPGKVRIVFAYQAPSIEQTPKVRGRALPRLTHGGRITDCDPFARLAIGSDDTRLSSAMIVSLPKLG